MLNHVRGRRKAYICIKDRPKRIKNQRLNDQSIKCLLDGNFICNLALLPSINFIKSESNVPWGMFNMVGCLLVITDSCYGRFGCWPVWPRATCSFHTTSPVTVKRQCDQSQSNTETLPYYPANCLPTAREQCELGTYDARN